MSSCTIFEHEKLGSLSNFLKSYNPTRLRMCSNGASIKVQNTLASTASTYILCTGDDRNAPA